jgi:hypothetical protein
VAAGKTPVGAFGVQARVAAMNVGEIAGHPGERFAASVILLR